MREALELCPSIVFLEARHEVYVRNHLEIRKTVESCIPVDVIRSIDEMACRLSGSQREESKAIASIGLAPNRYLAKLASDMQKPDGLTLLRGEDLPHSLYSMQLSDLPGVGYRTEKHLTHFGIQTVEQLSQLDRATLHHLWHTVWGERIYDWLHGEWESLRRRR